MKKLTSLLLAGAMAAAMLSGCSSNPSTSGPSGTNPGAGEKVEIEFWNVWSDESETGKHLAQAAKDFTAENPDITVKVSGQDGYDAVAEKIEAAIVAKNLPTIAIIEETFLGRFSPVAADMEKYVPAETVSNYQEGLLASSRIDGKLKSVPFNRSTTILYLNKNLLKKAGLPEEGPKDWTEYEQFAKAMTDPANDVWGAGQDWDTDAWIWESMLYSFGGEIISDDNKTVLFNNYPEAAGIIERMQRMAKEGTLFNPYQYQGAAWDILKAKFAEGKVGMMVTSIGSFASIQELAKASGFEVGLAFQPKGTQYSVTTGGGNIIMFDSATEAQKQAAGKFLAFLANDENAATYSKISGYFPVTKTSVGHQIMKEVLKEAPAYQVAIDQLQYAHRRPLTKNWRNMYTAIMEELKECMVNTDTDAKAAVASAAQQCQKIVDENP